MGIKQTFIKNTSLNLISYVYLVIAAIFSIPVLVHYLGIKEFGFYTLVISMVPIFSILDLGISQATVRFLSLPDYNEKERIKVWQTSLFFFLVTGIILFFVTIGVFQFYLFHLPLVSSISIQRIPLMLVVATTILLNHLNIHFLTLPQAQSRYDIYSLNAFIAGSANTWLSALAAFLWSNLFVICLVRFLGVLITLILVWLYSRRYWIMASFPKFHRQIFSQMISFGLKSFAGRAFGSVEAYGLNFILASFIALQAVTYFSIPQSLIIKAAGGISMLTLSLFPLSTSLLTRDGFPKLKRLIFYLQTSVTGLGLLGVIIIFIAGKPLLSLWLNNSELVNQAYPLLQILSVQLFLTSLTPMPTAVLESMNLPQIPSFFAFLTVIIEFILIAMFLPDFGIKGVAMAISGAASITVPIFLIIFFLEFRKFGQAFSVTENK